MKILLVLQFFIIVNEIATILYFYLESQIFYYFGYLRLNYLTIETMGFYHTTREFNNYLISITFIILGIAYIKNNTNILVQKANSFGTLIIIHGLNFILSDIVVYVAILISSETLAELSVISSPIPIFVLISLPILAYRLPPLSTPEINHNRRILGVILLYLILFFVGTIISLFKFERILFSGDISPNEIGLVIRVANAVAYLPSHFMFFALILVSDKIFSTTLTSGASENLAFPSNDD